MGEKTTQLCPVSPEIRIAWYEGGTVRIYPPVCVALVERGTARDTVFLEVVDNEIRVVDPDHEDFLGFVMASDFDKIKELKEEAEKRYEKENNGKPKQ
jgi:hypothetical protein